MTREEELSFSSLLGRGIKCFELLQEELQVKFKSRDCDSFIQMTYYKSQKTCKKIKT